MLSLLKKETLLVSMLLMNGLKLIDSHITTLDIFQVFILSDLKLILPKISNSTAPRDLIPTRLCKTVLTNFPDYVIATINLILQTRYFPNQLKQGTVKPLIKKSELDPELLSSYRHVTNLRFLSKVVERVVFEKLFSIWNIIISGASN